VVQQRYNLGTSSLLEVLQAETTLDNARAQLINARVNARIAKANIEALIGRDLK
jgi:outer membrane protein TolC